MIAALRRLVGLGVVDTTPDRLARQIQVTNTLALVGIVLSISGIPIDAYGSPPLALASDIISLLGFAACPALCARGYHKAARAILLLVGNATILASVVVVSSLPATRTVFFPLVLLPFLVFSISERFWLIVFALLPIISYGVTGIVGPDVPAASEQVYEIYAPILAFAMLVTGSAVFAYIDQTADAKLVAARARAAHAAQLVALGEMASGIAHEIRNPLAAIHLAATEIATNPGKEAHVAQLGERIQRIVMRAARIIETLRSVARDASNDPFVVTPVERIISDTLELCGKRIAEHGIKLEVGTIPTGLAVECRPVQLTQVLMNLVSNAYDAASTGTERWVRIDVASTEHELEMSVTDSGPGIPAAVRERIFEPFFTTKSPERGTGLGLSLSGGLVAAHHGTLEIDTASPHTRFVLRVPLAQPRGTGSTAS